MINIVNVNFISSVRVHRSRFVYALLVLLTVGLGLATRHFSNLLPHWVQLYLGDGLWALMIFLLTGLFFHRISSLWVAIAALAFSYTVEITQLYHAPWIDALRSNPLGGKILGFGFLWSDLICYTLGVAFGYMIEKICLPNQGI